MILKLFAGSKVLFISFVYSLWGDLLHRFQSFWWVWIIYTPEFIKVLNFRF